jgi:hypothetical protein
MNRKRSMLGRRFSGGLVDERVPNRAPLMQERQSKQAYRTSAEESIGRLLIRRFKKPDPRLSFFGVLQHPINDKFIQ